MKIKVKCLQKNHFGGKKCEKVEFRSDEMRQRERRRESRFKVQIGKKKYFTVLENTLDDFKIKVYKSF